MYNNYYEQFIIIQSIIETNRQETDEKKINTDEKLTQITEHLKVLTENITPMMDQTNNSKLSSYQKFISNPLEPTTVVPYNKRFPPLDGGQSTKIGGMWTLKHEIISPKFYEILIKR